MSSLVERRLTRAEFQGLAEMPAEVEWFQNLDSLNTSASYQVDLRNFMKFLGIEQAEEFREVTRAHVIAWRDNAIRVSPEWRCIKRVFGSVNDVGFLEICGEA